VPERVYYDTARELIVVESQGVVSLQEMNQSLSRIKDLAQNQQQTCLLVDTRDLKRFPEILEIARFTDSIPRSMHIAILYASASERVIRQITLFASQYPEFIRAFTNEDEALKWLAQWQD